MAFPYHLTQHDDCDETTSEVARAWDLVTGDPLPDYPLDGMKIAQAAVSGDGSRAIVLSPDGTVSIVSMSSGEPIRDLTTADVGEVYNPLALNTAVLDAEATKWTIYTLDPAEWADKACANGLALDWYKDELESLGMRATC